MLRKGSPSRGPLRCVPVAAAIRTKSRLCHAAAWISSAGSARCSCAAQAQTRGRVKVCSQSSDSREAPAAGQLFDRREERASLERLIKTTPSKLVVLLGPRSCGKTALFQRLLSDKPHAVHIDCRQIYSVSPDPFTNAVLKQIAQAAPRDGLSAALRALWSATSVEAAIKLFKACTPATTINGTDFTQATANSTQDAAFDDVGQMMSQLASASASTSMQPAQAPDMSAFLEAAGALLREWNCHARRTSKAQQRPVLVIDEANLLMTWQESHPAELSSLLNFLVAVSKQNQHCHVLLATSDWGLPDWLQQAISADFFELEVIGDFPESDARGFLVQALRGEGVSAAALCNDTWQKVYEVCGGNAGCLRRLATGLATHPPSSLSDWDAALAKLAAVVLRRAKQYAGAGSALGWTAAQYAAAALAVLDSPHNAVLEEDMQQLLGRLVQAEEDVRPGDPATAGAAVLLRMVQANALAVQPVSCWAHDIPVAAFGYGDYVVTAPSAVSLHCMGRLRATLERRLQGAVSMEVVGTL